MEEGNSMDTVSVVLAALTAGAGAAAKDTWQKSVQKSLVETGADQGEAIVRQAQQVLELVNPQQASKGKYNVQIGQGKGIAIGDNAQVHQTFGEK